VIIESNVSFSILAQELGTVRWYIAVGHVAISAFFGNQADAVLLGGDLERVGLLVVVNVEILGILIESNSVGSKIGIEELAVGRRQGLRYSCYGCTRESR